MKKRQHAVKSRRSPVERTRAGDAFSMFVVRVLRLSALLGSIGDALAKPAGQTTARWQVLAAVEDSPATVAQIARALGLARQSVQRVADVLERDGLAAYEDNPLDLRADRLRLTARGHATLSEIQDAQRVWADGAGAKVGESDLRRASEILDRVAAAVDESGSH